MALHHYRALGLGCALAGLTLVGCVPSADYSHYDQAQVLLAQGKVDDALLEFQQSLARDPTDPAVYDAVAKAYFNKGLLDQAIASWEQVLKYSSPDTSSYGNDRSGRLRKTEWISDAVAAYKDAFSKLKELYLKQGDDLDSRGLTDGAIQYWQKAAGLDPKNADPYRRLGKAFKKTGDTQKALGVWQKLTDIAPDDADAWKELGYAFFMTRAFDDSARAFKAYVKLRPADALGYNNLGTVYTKLEKNEAAKDAFQQALQKDPHMVSALNGLASAYYFQKDYVNARKYWTQALQIEPDNEKAKKDISTLTGMGY